MKRFQLFTFMLLLVQCIAVAQVSGTRDPREKLIKEVESLQKSRDAIMDSIYGVKASGGNEVKMLPIFERNLRIWESSLQGFEIDANAQRHSRHKTVIFPQINTSGGVTSFSCEHGQPRVPAQLDFMPGSNSRPMISRWEWKVSANSITVSGTERLNVQTGFDSKTYRPVKPQDPFTAYLACKGNTKTVKGGLILHTLPNHRGEYRQINLPCKVTVSCSHSNYYITQTAIVTGEEDLNNMLNNPEGYSSAVDSRDFAVTNVLGNKRAVDGDYNPYCFTHRTTHKISLANVAQEAGITMDSLANLLSNTYVKEIYMIAHMEYEEAGVFYLTGFEQLAINTAFLQRKYPSASSMEGLTKEIEKGTAKIAEMNKSTGDAKRMLMRHDTKLVKLYSSLIDHTWTALDHMPADAYKNKEYEEEVNRYKGYCAALQRCVKNVGAPTDDMKARLAKNSQREELLDEVLKLRKNSPDLKFFASLQDNEFKRHYATKIYQHAVDSVASIIKEKYLLTKQQKNYFSQYFPLMAYIWEISRDSYYSKGSTIEPQIKFTVEERRKIDLFDIATERANTKYNIRHKYNSKEEELEAANAELAYTQIENRWSIYERGTEIGKDFDILYAMRMSHLTHKVDKSLHEMYHNWFTTLHNLDSERFKKSPAAKLIFSDILYEGDNKDFYKVPKKVKKQAIEADDWHILYDHCINMGKDLFSK